VKSVLAKYRYNEANNAEDDSREQQPNESVNEQTSQRQLN